MIEEHSCGGRENNNRVSGRRSNMLAVVLFLLVLLLFGLGFAVKALWFVAVVALLAWVAGFAFRSGEGRWYRW
jgi:hypothetical protein